jgi:glycosylphosphatidylinositol transamidase (GPIT) subunit GPI8
MPLSTIYFSYIAAVHMIGQSKMNERLHDMTLNEILLDLKKRKIKNRYNKILFFIDSAKCI